MSRRLNVLMILCVGALYPMSMGALALDLVRGDVIFVALDFFTASCVVGYFHWQVSTEIRRARTDGEHDALELLLARGKARASDKEDAT